MATATTAITAVVTLPMFRTFLSFAFLSIRPLYRSCDTEDEHMISCESAVDMIAASIPHRKSPPINASGR